MAFTTAQRAIDLLESAAIVPLATEARRNRVYCARAILEILEEPPRLDTIRRGAARQAAVTPEISERAFEEAIECALLSLEGELPVAVGVHRPRPRGAAERWLVFGKIAGGSADTRAARTTHGVPVGDDSDHR